LYESLQKLPGFEVCRHLRPANEIENPEKSTLVIAGAASDSYIISQKELFDFVLKGGRLVLIFSPEAEASYFIDEKKKKEAGKKEKKRKESIKKKDDSGKKAPENKEKEAICVLIKKEKAELERLKKRWGFELEKNRRSFVIETNIAPHEESMKEYGFSEMSFYSPLNLKLMHEDWIVHYSYRGKAAIAERHYGKGSVILSVACYFISNESLSNGPQVNLLRHAFMERERILFHESHHGLREERNIVWLGKKYKLAILLLNLIFLAALYVWKSVFSISGHDALVEGGTGKIKSTFNSALGLVNLLKRGVPRKGLVASCFKEWDKTIKYRRIFQNKRDEIRNLADASESPKDQVNTYNQINKTISKMKARGK
jgi:hypothetical protein